MFSRLSVFLKRLPAKTLPELQWSLEEAYFKTKKPKKPSPYIKRKPITQVIDSVTDFGVFLDGLLVEEEREKWNLIDSLAYQLVLNESQDGVYLKSKALAVNEKWMVYLLILSPYVLFFLD